jgi:precorrin-2/cobalt-factor-2 C20-methyltransferase
MATPDAVNFMATHGRGLICLTLTSERLDELDLPLMAAQNSSRHETAFTVSIEAREGVTTGISAADRACTVAVAIDGSKGAADIAAALDRGQDVVCLCEGDPFFYGSFMYVFARLSGKYQVEVVPGVTSITACAATAGMPLAARNERLTVLPGPLPEVELRARIDGAESVVIMKVGRHMAKIRAVIESLGLTDRAMYVERATLPQEVVLPLKDAPEKAPYFSMILLTKGADPWL